MKRKLRVLDGNVNDMKNRFQHLSIQFDNLRKKMQTHFLEGNRRKIFRLKNWFGTVFVYTRTHIRRWAFSNEKRNTIRMRRWRLKLRIRRWRRRKKRRWWKQGLGKPPLWSAIWFNIDKPVQLLFLRECAYVCECVHWGRRLRSSLLMWHTG